MKNIIILFFLFFTAANSIAQDLTGKWVGQFIVTRPINDQIKFELIILKKDSAFHVFTKSFIIMRKDTFFINCKAEMKIDLKRNTITLTETENVGGNAPVEIRNCFQKHTLKYSVVNGIEMLTGSWNSAVKQTNCGEGYTTLEKKQLSPKVSTPQN